MARPREFNEEAALDAAIQRFRAQGFAAASVRDLASDMGITGASLYNAFGDKRALYLRALDSYVARGFDARVARFSVLPPRTAIAAFFADVMERALADPDHYGCMLVNAAADVSAEDPELRDAVAAVLARMEEFFRDRVAAGQADGSIAAILSAEDFGRLLLSTFLGMRVLSRSRPERALLEGVVRPVLLLLDPARPV